MHNTISISLLISAMTFCGVALASEDIHAMNHSRMMDSSSASAISHKAEGVVNKIDMHLRKINLTHGPIKSLGWSGMTMNFKVKDTALLKAVKAGQKVKFEVVKDDAGRYYINQITPSK